MVVKMRCSFDGDRKLVIGERKEGSKESISRYSNSYENSVQKSNCVLLLFSEFLLDASCGVSSLVCLLANV